MKCLVNTCKYASRRNSPFGVTSSIFFDSSISIAITKSVHKMHIAIFHMGKKRHVCTSQFTNWLQRTRQGHCITMSRSGQAHWTSMTSRTAYSTSTPQKPTHFDGHYLRNRSTLDIGVLGYIGIVWPKEYSPEVSHIPPVTPCIKSVLCRVAKRLSLYTGRTVPKG